MDWPLLLRPLPRPVPPVRDETITSYLARLAEANRLQIADLRHLLTDSRRKDAEPPLAGLAAITGMPPAALAHAMPQICTPHERVHVDATNRPRPQFRGEVIACRPCSATRPAAGPSQPGPCTTTWFVGATPDGSARTPRNQTCPGSRRSSTPPVGTGG